MTQGGGCIARKAAFLFRRAHGTLGHEPPRVNFPTDPAAGLADHFSRKSTSPNQSEAGAFAFSAGMRSR